MKKDLVTKGIIVLVLAVYAATLAFLYFQNQKLIEVVNRQGTIISFMLVTPEIQSVLSRELEKQQSNQ